MAHPSSSSQLKSSIFLPFDIVFHIVGFLDAYEVLSSAAFVNKTWNEACKMDPYWQSCIARHGWNIPDRENCYHICVEHMRTSSKPCYKGDCQRTNFYSNKPPSHALEVAWEIELDIVCKDSLIAFENRVYICEEGVGVHCFNIHDGEKLWTYESPNGSDRDTLEYCIARRQLVTISGNSSVVAISSDGKELWATEINSNENVTFVSQFVIRSGVVIFAVKSSTSKCELIGVAVDSGALLWRYPVAGVEVVSHHIASDEDDVAVCVINHLRTVDLLIFKFNNFKLPPHKHTIFPLNQKDFVAGIMLYKGLAVISIEGGLEGCAGRHVGVQVDVREGAASAIPVEVCNSGARVSLDKRRGILYVMNVGDFKAVNFNTLEFLSSSADDEHEDVELDVGMFGEKDSLSINGHAFGHMIATYSGLHAIEVLMGGNEEMMEFAVLDTSHIENCLPLRSWLPIEDAYLRYDDDIIPDNYVMCNEMLVYASEHQVWVFRNRL